MGYGPINSGATEAFVRATTLAGFVSTAGVVGVGDSILTAFNKVDGNIAAIGAVVAVATDLNGFTQAGSKNDAEFTLTIVANFLQLTPVGADFKVYVGGAAYTRIGDATDGFDLTTLAEGGTLLYYGPVFNATYPYAVTDATIRLRAAQGAATENPNLFKKYAFVHIGYWDDVNSKWLGQEERHGIVYPGDVHLHDHEIIGTKLLDNTSVVLSGFTFGPGAAATDANVQFDWYECDIIDEDIIEHIPAGGLTVAGGSLSTIMMYKVGLNWRWDVTDVCVKTAGGRALYNSGAGTQVQCGEGHYTCTYVVATQSAAHPFIFVQGRNSFALKANAEDDARVELSALVEELHDAFKEFVIVGIIVMQTSSAFINADKTICVQTASGDDYTDLRFENVNSIYIKNIPAPSVDNSYLTWNTGGGYWKSSVNSFMFDVDARIALKRGAVSGIAPLDAAQLLPLANLPAHAATHTPGQSDGLTCAAPIAQTPAQANAEGNAVTFARSNHVHNIACAAPIAQTPAQANAEGNAVTFARSNHVHNLAVDVAGTIQPDDTAAAGAAATFSRSDHRHAIACAAATTLTPAMGNAEGVSTSFARADHEHNLPMGTPVNIAVAVADPGVAATFARADHIHGITTGAPVAQTPAQANNAGTATTLARSDHIHNIPVAAAANQTPDQVSAAGAAATFARADHVHNIPAAIVSAVTIGAITAKGAAASFALSDHTHGVADGIPINQTITAVAAAGIAATFTRSDHSHSYASGAAATLTPNLANAAGGGASFAVNNHVHNVPTVAPISQTPGNANADGVVDSFSRSDHVHNLPCAAASTLAPDQANAEGAAATFARSNHIHNVAAAVAVGVGNANTKGSSVSFSLADHVHALCNSTAVNHDVPRFNGTNWIATQDDDLVSFVNSSILRDDFVGGTNTFGLNWIPTANGGLSIIASQAGTAGRPGQALLTAGNAASRYADLSLGASSLVLGGGAIIYRTSINLQALSIAANRYVFRCGLGNVIGNVPTQGVVFEYDETALTTWRLRTINGANISSVDSTVTVVAGAWVKLVFIVNAAGTSVEFFINDVSVGTLATVANIPTGAMTSNYHLRQGASAPATRYVIVDYFERIVRLTTSR